MDELTEVSNNRLQKWYDISIDIENNDQVFKLVNGLAPLLMRVYRNDNSLCNTYHTPQHMMATANIANELLIENHVKDVSFNKDQFVLYLASSLHDIDHRGTSGSDILNINRTILKIEDILPQTLLDGSNWYINEVIEAIKCTEFPFMYEPYNRVQMCLRDADLLTCLEDDWDVFFEGLKLEIEKPELTMKENINWLLDQTFYNQSLRGVPIKDVIRNKFADIL